VSGTIQFEIAIFAEYNFVGGVCDVGVGEEEEDDDATLGVKKKLLL
jgi:hypothetical protein